MANIPEPTSVSACPCSRPPIPFGTRLMRLKLLALTGNLLLAATLAGCLAATSSRNTQPLPTVDRSSTESTVISSYLDLCMRLARGSSAEQAEILANTSNDYSAAPTPSRVLRYAMVLSTPGHPGHDPVVAQRLL